LRQTNARRDRNVVRNSRKEYCSFWLRRGECDYQQQGKCEPVDLSKVDMTNSKSIGCIYRHDVPIDRPTLEKLGLRDIPRWYREKHGLPSLQPPRGRSNMAQIVTGQHYQTLTTASKVLEYPSRLDSTTAASDIPPLHHPVIFREQLQVRRGSPKLEGVNQIQECNDKASLAQLNHSARKIDLLSGDLLSEYPAMNAVGSSAQLGTLANKGLPEENRLAQSQDFAFNMQSLMPGPVASHADVYTPPVKAAPGQHRPRKAHKSRQLYRRVPENATKNASSGAMPKNKRNNSAKGLREASTASKSSVESGSVAPPPPTALTKALSSTRVAATASNEALRMHSVPLTGSVAIHTAAPTQIQQATGSDKVPESVSVAREGEKGAKGREIDLFDLALEV
jgi:hypothetical protein